MWNVLNVKCSVSAPREIGLRHVSSEIMDKVKSTGTDDGFKGEPAACAYSVLAVAQTMVSGGTVINFFQWTLFCESTLLLCLS